MKWFENYEHWKNNVTKEKRKVLEQIPNKEIKELFGAELSFGTAGIRAKFGEGPNRVNYNTIFRFVKAYALLLKNKYQDDPEKLKKGVLIFHDNRHGGEEFSLFAAEIFASEGIGATLAHRNKMQPTPLLSYFIQVNENIGGLNITASHNSKEYGGIKFYGALGSQLESVDTDEIRKYMDDISYFDIDFDFDSKLISKLKKDFEDEYLDNVIQPLIGRRLRKPLKVLFTPQHGTSLHLVKKIAKMMHIDLHLVKSQAIPDPDFSNTLNPNPGTLEAFEAAIPIAINQDISVIISIDPDGDRLGMMVKDDNNWVHLNGNDLAILILNYLIKSTKSYKLKNKFIVKSIVTSDQGKRIAEKHGIKVFETLTGFKSLSNKAIKVQQDQIDQNVKPKKILKPLFVYEESYGSIVDISVKDKDALQAFVMVIKTLASLSASGDTISETIKKINQKYGKYKTLSQTKEVSSTREAEQFLVKVKRYFADETNKKILKHVKFDYVDDLSNPKDQEQIPTLGLKIYFKNNNWVAIRPSGTEPLIKFYYDFYELDATEEAEIISLIDRIFLN